MNARRFRRLVTFAVCLTWSLAIPGVRANEDVLRQTAKPGQWAIQTGNYANSRFSALDQITTANAHALRVAWTFSTGLLRGHEGGPLVIGDVMYVHTPFPNIVYALDLKDPGRILWKYEPRQDASVMSVLCCDAVNRGPAYAEGMLFLAQADTTVIALDARTGQVRWKAVNGDPAVGETNTATVLPVKDKIIVGNAGSDFGVRGHVTAYDMKTGRRLWRAYSNGPDADMLVDPERTTTLGKPVGKDSSIRSWNGDQWKTGGGSPWGWFSYDPELNLFYYGTANPGSWNPVQRAGPDGKPIDQRWTASVFARDADTGVARWVYQFTPFDQWDYDGVNEMILAPVEVEGRKRDALVHFSRSGIAYTLDRATGDLLAAAKFDPSVNWTSGVVMDRSRSDFGRPTVVPERSPFLNGEDTLTKGVCPANLGSKDQQPAAHSPLTNLFYVPTNHICMDIEPFRVTYVAGQLFLGASFSGYPAPDSHGGTGNFIAWDAAKGEVAWSKAEPFFVWSGALTTAGGVVCYGTLEGYLKCLDQKDGRELYRFKTPSGIVGNVATYMHDGKQYLVVYSGVGGLAGVGLSAGLTSGGSNLEANTTSALRNYTNLGGTVTVFSLP